MALGALQAAAQAERQRLDAVTEEEASEFTDGLSAAESRRRVELQASLATLALLQQPCGVHSDKCDAGVYEVISYVHSAAPSSAPGGGALLAMALRLRGGAVTTRQQKANKKR